MIIFKYGFILNMVNISNMDTQHYLPSESNHVMSTNGKVSDLLIIKLITASLAPTAGAFLPQIPYFYILFRYLKTVALIILNKTENHKDEICQKIYAFIFSNSHLLLKSTTL